jgi:hypothetical protein
MVGDLRLVGFKKYDVRLNICVRARSSRSRQILLSVVLQTLKKHTRVYLYVLRQVLTFCPRQAYADDYNLKVVLALHHSPGDPLIEIVARLPPHLLPHSLPPLDESDPKTAVALRQGFNFLTTFHPELTNDNRFHDYFIRECVLPADVKRC